jgi:hypothetical protein
VRCSCVFFLLSAYLVQFRCFSQKMESSTCDKMRALNESNAKFYRDVKSVCVKLNMSEKDVLGVYLYGRLEK